MMDQIDYVKLNTLVESIMSLPAHYRANLVLQLAHQRTVSAGAGMLWEALQRAMCRQEGNAP